MITKNTIKNEFHGLSTDDWSMNNPTLKSLKNGDVGFEMDTIKAKEWDEQNKRWCPLN